jgi:metal-dependent HD superfamily phosphatase/phosphodiesterase
MNKDKTLISIIYDLIERQINKFLTSAISVDLVKIKEINEIDLNAKVQSLESQGEYFVDLVLDKEKKTAWIKPKVGSTAYVTSNNGVKFFCLFTQIEKIVIGDGTTEQGVIKIKEQQDEINNKLKD